MITNTLFAIGIPTVNRADLLNPNLEKYASQLFPGTSILVLDNGRQKELYQHRNITIIETDANLFVSPSWNALCRNIFDRWPWILLLNDDIDFGSSEKDLTEYLHKNPYADFICGFAEWSAFLLPKKTYESVGPFDERFPVWHGDNDYTMRMKAVNKEILYTSLLTPSLFRRSQSAAKDPLLHKQFEISRQAYVTKYGGNPGFETKQ